MKGVTVYPYQDGSSSWAVEHIDLLDDGLVEKAIFSGENAERQAKSFALAEYGLNEPVRLSA